MGSFSFLSTIFQGEQVIKADKLIEISTEDIHQSILSKITDKNSDFLSVLKNKMRKTLINNIFVASMQLKKNKKKNVNIKKVKIF